MKNAIAVLNAGSSSLKFTTYLPDLKPVLCGQIDGLVNNPHFSYTDFLHDTQGDRDLTPNTTHDAAIDFLLDWLAEHYGSGTISAFGHRVVHGGPKYHNPILVNDNVLEDLETFVSLAPLHQPHNLGPIRKIHSRAEDIPQVACFDTAFHRTHDKLADRFALPLRYEQEGIQRYGFHGLSYEYIASQIGIYSPAKKVIVAHLGNGASLCAMHDGKSIDSTMGFSALDGLMMGTRCGTIDPGVILYLLQQKNMDVSSIEKLLYKESGLLGVSGISNDVRKLLASSDPNAQDAISLFCYRIVKEIGGLVSVLNGLDALVFTAGIGEHAAPIRKSVCHSLSWLGLKLDEHKNQSHETRIHSEDSQIDVLVIPTDEEKMIALHTKEILLT